MYFLQVCYTLNKTGQFSRAQEMTEEKCYYESIALLTLFANRDPSQARELQLYDL